MGASKEGTMSVRERINLVLRESLSLSQEDGELGDGKGSRHLVPTTTSLSSVPSKGSVGGGISNSGVSVSTSPSFSGNNKSILEFGGRVNPKKEEGSSESPTPSSLSVSTWTGSWLDEALELAKLLEANKELDLRRLIINHLNLLYDSSRRWEASESEREVERREREREQKERDQLQATIDSERLEKSELLKKNETLEEQRLRNEATIKEQVEKIKELERQLVALTTPKPMVHQGTAMTPRPPSPPSPEAQHIEEEDGEIFPRKRRKLNSGEDEVTASSSNKLPKSSTLTPYVQSHPGKFMMPNRRSDSPPQLSLAVTPKSTTQNHSLQCSGARAFTAFLPGDRVGDEFSEYPPAEFHNELDRINYLSQDSTEARRGSHSAPLQRLLPSGSSAFSPPPPRPIAKLVIPERNRTSFMPNSPLKSMQQFRQQHSTTTALANSLAPKNSSSDISNTFSRHPPPISMRSNNFLKMSRPIPRKAPLPTTSFQSYSLADDPSRQSRSGSLDSSTSTPEAAKTTSEDLTVTPKTDTPTPPIKRPRGRPVGFRPPKRTRVPAVNRWSTGRVDSSDNRLSNGALDGLQQLKSEPPPIYSRRGRRIKPNTSRYSPDPDSTTHSREKFMTTNKNYFAQEPFVPEGYGEPRDIINPDTLRDGETDPLSRQELEDEIVYPPARPTEKEGEECEASAIFVEVPRWRITNMDEEFETDEGRKSPVDDMSEEAYVKRHQKPEVQEKQRKRWDLQMLREESYKERMQRKQQEREKQKELRRQQRKRKGRTGATEEEVVNPSVEDIKAVYVSPDLPVGAFGQTLPINEKVDFHFSSGCVSPPPPALPSPKPVLTVHLDNANHDTDVIKSSKVRNSVGSSSSAVTRVVNVNTKQMGISSDKIELEKDAEGIAVDDGVDGRPVPTPPPPSFPSCSSPASSSLPHVLSSSFPKSSTPPPPVIFCVRDSDSKSEDVYEYTDDDNFLIAPILSSLDRTKSISDKRKEREESPVPPYSIESTSSVDTKLGPSSCSPARVSTSTTLFSPSKILPSVTIPLLIPLIKGRNPSGGSSRETVVVNQLDNSTTASGAISKRANVKFFIPNNPLARPKPRPPPALPLSCSTTSSSVKMSDDEHPSKNKNLQS